MVPVEVVKLNSEEEIKEKAIHDVPVRYISGIFGFSEKNERSR